MDPPITVPGGGTTPRTEAPMTADELLALHEQAGQRAELHQGRLVRMPVAGGSHDVFAARLVALLSAHVYARNLGEITLSQAGYDVTLPSEAPTVYIPDLAFVRAERVPAPDSAEWSRHWKFAPDLVVEVVSPSQHHPEMDARAREWITRGARLVWMLWPNARSVEVWRPIAGAAPPTGQRIAIRGIGDELDGADVLPGFTCAVAQLFRQ